MAQAIALIITDTGRTRLGLPSRLDESLVGTSVLEHTVRRAAQVKSVAGIVLVHPAGQDPAPLLGGRNFDKPVSLYADDGGLSDELTAMRAAARKWALGAWRGGLGGAGCFDELLPAGPMAAAMDEHKAESALILGGDWPAVDPLYCQQVLEQHLSNPDAMAFTFTQAPPGLGGAAVGRKLVGELADKRGMFGQILSYNPTAPQADPIGRDVCIAIDAPVRSCARRFIYDTQCSAAMIDAVADQLGRKFASATAAQIVEALGQVEVETQGVEALRQLPQQIALELTAQRPASGPILPQQYVDFDRQPIELELALRIVEQLGVDGDTVLTLGGLGDALLYEHWRQVVDAAHAAGVLGIAIETDLLVDGPVLADLVDSPVDVVSVRLNADTARLYQQVMGQDQFAQVARNLQWLLQQRFGAQDSESGHIGQGDGRDGLPWVVPRLVKTDQTLDDMESFFDRWVHFAGSAVIEPATTGCGLMPALSPLPMAPPRRMGCRQIEHRMTIHSDGRVAQCDQDWLGRSPGGDAASTPLAEIWQSMTGLRREHRHGRGEQLALCGSCDQWHRP